MARGRTYKAGKRVPGAKNVGIIARAAGTFEAFVSYDGKRWTAGTHPSVEEARAAQVERLRELHGKGTGASLRAKRTTFGEYWPAFWKHHYNHRSKPKRPSTLRAAESRYRTYIHRHFSHRALVHVTATAIREFADRLAEGHYPAPESVEREVHGVVRTFYPRRVEIPSEKTQREVLLLVRAMLAAAVEDGLLVANPFPLKIIPSGRPKNDATTKKARVTPNDVVRIVANISSLKHHCIAAVLAYAGLRLGETLALKWGDVDFRRGYLRVERSADAKTRTVGPPKTAHGERDVPLDPELSKILQAYRRTRKATRPDDWMFPSERQRRSSSPSPPIIDQRTFVQRYWDPARKKVTAKRITPHTARHIWCSVMVTLFPVADVSAWAGHHSPSFTYDRYVKPLEQATKTSPLKRSIYAVKGRRS